MKQCRSKRGPSSGQSALAKRGVPGTLGSGEPGWGQTRTSLPHLWISSPVPTQTGRRASTLTPVLVVIALLSACPGYRDVAGEKYRGEGR